MRSKDNLLESIDEHPIFDSMPMRFEDDEQSKTNDIDKMNQINSRIDHGKLII